MSSEQTVTGSVEHGDWTFSYSGVRMTALPRPCPWPYSVMRGPSGRALRIVQLREREVIHVPSGDKLILRWDPDRPLARDWEWRSSSGSRDYVRIAEAFALLHRGWARRGRPPGRETIQSPEEVAEVYARLTKAASGRKPTQERVAKALGYETRSLQRYMRRHSIRWPPI